MLPCGIVSLWFNVSVSEFRDSFRFYCVYDCVRDMWKGRVVTYSWIKQPPTHTKENPHIHHQAKPKYQTDIQQHTRIRRLRQS